MLAGLAFGVPLMAYAASIYEDKGQFALVQRFIFMPMFLFSGTFYPLDSLPLWLQWIGWISPLWHATELGRWISYGAELSPAMIAVHFGYLIVLTVVGLRPGRSILRDEARQVSAVTQAPDAVTRRGGVRALWAGNPGAVVQRGLIAARSSSWAVVLSGFFEPVFYLASMGIGLGALIGTVETSTGLEVSYAAFIAPALLAVSAMNGAIYDSTWNVFFKLNYGKLYEGMLSTSLGPLDVALGEIIYALLRGLLYATGFMIIMQIAGLNLAWTAILAIPAVLLIAFGFASVGMAVTSYMKAFQQMDWINIVLLPMFLFSATLLPDHGLSRVHPVDRQGAAAVARSRAGPRPHDRRALTRDVGARRVLRRR